MLAVGAHPDDIEIGAGGMLLSLAESEPRVRYVVLTGTAERQEEARNAARCLPARCRPRRGDLFDLPEGRLPAAWGQVKEILETVARIGFARRHPRPLVRATPIKITGRSARSCRPSSATSSSSRTRSRSGTVTSSRPSVYFPLSADVARRKVELLHKCFPSQRDRDWWDDEVFLGIARLRGMECRAPYAEAFSCAKSVITVAR